MFPLWGRRRVCFQLVGCGRPVYEEQPCGAPFFVNSGTQAAAQVRILNVYCALQQEWATIAKDLSFDTRCSCEHAEPERARPGSLGGQTH